MDQWVPGVDVRIWGEYAGLGCQYGISKSQGLNGYVHGR